MKTVVVTMMVDAVVTTTTMASVMMTTMTMASDVMRMVAGAVVITMVAVAALMMATDAVMMVIGAAMMGHAKMMEAVVGSLDVHPLLMLTSPVKYARFMDTQLMTAGGAIRIIRIVMMIAMTRRRVLMLPIKLIPTGILTLEQHTTSLES
jgi:hypothetical protein